jgi:3-deoxy-manno-octulosonate cytidylyltransferase (CMP-KDO synthetase)
MKAIAIIPARYASTRFPAKALEPLLGKPLILWVREAVSATGLFSQVIVATDSELIREAVVDFGGKAVMTSPSHASGTDRVHEAASGLDYDVIVNVQGDEPLITREALDALLGAFADESVRIATLMAPIDDPAMLNDPNTVKVVADSSGNALYFSRAGIPFNRDGGSYGGYWRHIGVYAYRREALERFVKLPPSPLEQVEKLEQLRALENGIPIRLVPTSYQGIGIDTQEDLEKVEIILRSSH